MILNISYRFILFSVAAGLLFFFYPQLDIYFSSLFFSEGTFYLKSNPFVRLIYKGAPPLTGLFFMTVVISYAYISIKKRAGISGLSRKACLFLILAMILGPLLVVNGIMKETSGRARPRHVAEFGGSKQFTRAFIFSDQCSKNCSFVSGHASAGFYFVSLALLFKGRKKRIIFWSSVAAGGFIGLIRVMMGGHFLSDVVFSFVFVYLTSLLLHHQMFGRGDHKS